MQNIKQRGQFNSTFWTVIHCPLSNFEKCKLLRSLLTNEQKANLAVSGFTFFDLVKTNQSNLHRITWDFTTSQWIEWLDDATF